MVKAYYLKDNEFQNLCEEYFLASESLSKLKRLFPAQNPDTISEFTFLVAELEAEIEGLLSTFKEGKE